MVEATKVKALVDAIREFDPATLYEAAGKAGMVDPGIRPAWPGARLCGTALPVRCPAGDNLALHHAVVLAAPGDIIVATASGYLCTGAWGEILTVAAQARGIAGLAIDGAVRDIEAIRELGFPIFSRGLAIGSCTKMRPGEVGSPIEFGGVQVATGDLIMGDADGLVVIARATVERVYEAACQRRDDERAIIGELRAGKTTLELLKLDPVTDAKALLS
jgi:4-hydroxy-4-methyl-2-oxoglutarate aldolase